MTTIQNKVAQNAAPKPAEASPQSKSITIMMNEFLDREGVRKRFDELLGARAPQFISSVVSLVNSDANMQQAFMENRMSVIQSALKAAIFDLPIEQSLGYAYLVPFKNKDKETGKHKMTCTFILGWKGMNQLALRTGAYKTITVTDVRQGELKSYNRLTEEIDIDFIEDWDERESMPIIGYVGFYKLVNGATKTIYMTVKQIEAHEKKFRKGEYMGKGWSEDWDSMARKTIYRRLIGKYGVMSIQYQTAAVGSETAEFLKEQFFDETPAPIIVDTDTGEATEESKNGTSVD